jgi:hypothetical protein
MKSHLADISNSSTSRSCSDLPECSCSDLPKYWGRFSSFASLVIIHANKKPAAPPSIDVNENVGI